MAFYFDVKAGVRFSVLAMSISATAAVAQDVNNEQWLLAKYDVNGDSVISSNEIEDKRKQAFAHMDADRDGAVSFEEYEYLDARRREAILEARFGKLDIDHDGRLTGEEYSSYLGSFERLDHNGDGQVSSDEMSSTEKSGESVKKRVSACLLWFCVRKGIRD